MTINDAHCHFFSDGFFQALGTAAALASEDAAQALPERLGWEPPGDPVALADRWIAELDRHGVSRAMLIASVPGDETSVATAVHRHPRRLVGAFMVDPAEPELERRLDRAFEHTGLRTVCLFPAMHHVPIDSPAVRTIFTRAEQAGRALFIHCGLLSIGIRQKLGLPSAFDLRLGDPLAVAAVAVRYPSVPVVIPHFGAGRFVEALMAASSAPNIVFDSSSSNGWIRLHPNLTLRDVFARALDVLGPERLLFGTDSSFFPRGWQRPIYEAQLAALEDLGVDGAARALIFGGNFSRILAHPAG